jgi:acetoin utilization deacetylase AcuC-like enzyme
MMFYDAAFNMRFFDYGIMLPVAPDRAERVLECLRENFVAGTRGPTLPYPGPVFDTALALSYLRETGPALRRSDLERVHSGEFTASLFGGGAALEKALLTAFELIDEQGRPHRYEPERAVASFDELFSTILAHAGGTYLACRLALTPGPGFCYFLGGGMHHARYDSGAGFCLVNDIVIAARKIQAEGRASLVWVIDLDAHKGDGTAELVRFARERGELADPSDPPDPPNPTDPAVPDADRRPCILTLSIHMAKGWPLDSESLAAAKEGRAPLIPSDIDIGVDSGEEAAYLSKLASGLAGLERLSAASGCGKPDLVIVVDGADPYEHDGLPSSRPLKLTLEQCLDRDRYVYRYLTGKNIPSAWIQAGGYGERAWEPCARFLCALR